MSVRVWTGPPSGKRITMVVWNRQSSMASISSYFSDTWTQITSSDQCPWRPGGLTLWISHTFWLICVSKKKNTDNRELQFEAFNNDFSSTSTYKICWIPRMKDVRPDTTVASMWIGVLWTHDITKWNTALYIFVRKYLSKEKGNRKG